MQWNRSQFNDQLQKFTQKHSKHWKLLESKFTQEAILKSHVEPEIYSKSIFTDSESELEIEFFITYSPSYQVPVLFFLPFISKNDILTAAKIDDLKQLLSGDQAAISFAENPINHIMMYSIHPCLTSKFMGEIFSSLDHIEKISSFSAIESWISFCPLKPLKSLIIDPDVFNFDQNK